MTNYRVINVRTIKLILNYVHIIYRARQISITDFTTSKIRNHAVGEPETCFDLTYTRKNEEMFPGCLIFPRSKSVTYPPPQVLLREIFFFFFEWGYIKSKDPSCSKDSKSLYTPRHFWKSYTKLFISLGAVFWQWPTQLDWYFIYLKLNKSKLLMFQI